MNETRYVYTTVLLSEKEQRQRQKEFKESIKLEIKELKQEIKNLKQLAKSADLPKTMTLQKELNPGDEGYEDAPVCFNPYRYQGNVTWQNVK